MLKKKKEFDLKREKKNKTQEILCNSKIEHEYFFRRLRKKLE